MAILKRLKEKLDEAKIPYEVYTHALAYTAQEIAARQHVSGNELAKVVMIEADEQLVMAVVRGNDKVNLHIVEDSLAARNARLATKTSSSHVSPNARSARCRRLVICLA